MKIKYLAKEAKYYKNLGKGHLKRMGIKFALAKTPLSKGVNGKFYNKIYSRKVKKEIGKAAPRTLQIENTNLCNATCIMCPHTIMKRKGRTMSQKEFEKICKNVMDYEKIKNITITGFGEPMIDKEIDKKIEWLNNNYPKAEIDIYTNASLLSQEVSDKLLGLKLHKINFSINGTEKSYKGIMGLNYDKTKENILYFLKKKKERGLNYPLTNISLMVIKENEKEIEEVVSFWKDKTDSIMTYMPSDWAGSLKSVSFVAKNPFKPKRWPCKVLWDSVTVDVDGNVIMCCRDYESIVKFGNLLKHNIKEIRQSEKFRTLRDSQSKYDFSSQICSACDNCFDSSLNWWGK